MKAIAPDVELKETISSPESPEKVIGFLGRNTVLGVKSVVMKNTDQTDERVYVPMEYIDILDPETSKIGGELLVLQDDEVLQMSGPDFYEEQKLHTLDTEVGKITMAYVETDSPTFQRWDREKVTVSN